MSLKIFLFLAPVAVGGWLVTHRDAGAPAGAETAKAAPHKSAAECRELEQSLLEGSAADPARPNAFAAIQRVNAMAAELRRQGCEPGASAGASFQAPVSRMGPAPAGADSGPRADRTSFEPGRPMVDVGHHSR